MVSRMSRVSISMNFNCSPHAYDALPLMNGTRTTLFETCHLNDVEKDSAQCVGGFCNMKLYMSELFALDIFLFFISILCEQNHLLLLYFKHLDNEWMAWWRTMVTMSKSEAKSDIISFIINKIMNIINSINVCKTGQFILHLKYFFLRMFAYIIAMVW